MFLNGLHVSQRLAGMPHVAQRIDDRHGRPPRQIIHSLLEECSRHNSGNPAIQIPRHVFQWFADADRPVVQNGESAQLLNRQLKGNARAQRRLLKQQRQRLAAQSACITFGRTFHVRGKIKQRA